MNENATNCATCATLRKLKDDGEYYASVRPEKKDTCVTICKAAIVQEDYYKDGEKLEYGGRVTNTATQMRFCFECGRKLDEEELTW